MTQGAALYSFFSGFGVTAYPADQVPAEAEFPYLTYESAISYFEGGEVGIGVNLYYRTDSEATINAKAQDVADVIKPGGTVLACDNGYIWVRRGSPFIQSMADADTANKRRYINVTLEFFT